MLVDVKSYQVRNCNFAAKITQLSGLSASRAIDSADTDSFILEVLFTEHFGSLDILHHPDIAALGSEAIEKDPITIR